MKKQIRQFLDLVFLVLPSFTVKRKHPFSKYPFYFNLWYHRAFFPKKNERDKKLLRFIKKNLSFGDTAVDLGAHIGWFTQTMARGVGPCGLVFAVEPGYKNLELLNKNTKYLRQCTICPYVISSKTKTVQWHEEQKGGFNNAIYKKTEARIWNEQMGLKMVMQSEKRLAYSLDDFILKNKIKKIKITKIDCEEEDAKILLNSKKAAKICKIIILEKPKNPLKIYFWAKQNNFKILPDCFGKDSASLIFSK